MTMPFRFPARAPVTLNPHFFALRCIVPLERHGDRLVVGMADPDDRETLAVLGLATGYRVEAVSLSADRVAAALSTGPGAPGAPDWSLPALSHRPTRPTHRRHWRGRRNIAVLLPLAELLEAGCEAAEAADVLERSERAGDRLDPALRTLAAALAAGVPLNRSLGESSGLPAWLATCVTGCVAPAGAAAVLCGIVAAETAPAERHRGRPGLMVEAAAWSLPIGLVWSVSSFAAGIAVGTGALLLLARIGWLLGTASRTARRQTKALALTTKLAMLGVAPADGLRAGAARYAGKPAVWRELPNSRADLAEALALPPLPAALLLRGELADGAARAAEHCVRREGQAAARGRCLVHALGMTATCLALAALLA